MSGAAGESRQPLEQRRDQRPSSVATAMTASSFAAADESHPFVGLGLDADVVPPYAKRVRESRLRWRGGIRPGEALR